MTTLTCIAKITAKPEFKEIVFAELRNLVAPTMKESGCINYDLHRDNSDENVFFFHENWTSKEALELHMASQHIANCFAKIGDCVDSVEINEVTRVS